MLSPSISNLYGSWECPPVEEAADAGEGYDEDSGGYEVHSDSPAMTVAMASAVTATPARIMAMTTTRRDMNMAGMSMRIITSPSS